MGWGNWAMRGGSDELHALHEANRRRADLQIERQLVALRASLFRRAIQPAAPTPPALGADVGLPVVSRDELASASLQKAMASYGALHVRGLLSQERVELLCSAIDSSLEADAIASAC